MEHFIYFKVSNLFLITGASVWVAVNANWAGAYADN
jgi:hypothetical protein